MKRWALETRYGAACFQPPFCKRGAAISPACPSQESERFAVAKAAAGSAPLHDVNRSPDGIGKGVAA